jgi:CBS domain-containing protein
MDGEVPIGIVTERDIVRRVVAKKMPLDTKISEIMSKTLITVDPGTSLKEAARLMSSNKIRRLPVLEQNRLVGIVVAADFVRNLGKKTVPEEILEAIGRYPPTFP